MNNKAIKMAYIKNGRKAISILLISFFVSMLCVFKAGSITLNDDDASSLCNVYLESACFSLSSNYVLTMKLQSATEYIYTIKMPTAGNIKIYQGYNVEGPKTSDVIYFKKCKSENEDQCNYVYSNGNRYDLFFYPKSSASIHIIVENIDDKNIHEFRDFISNFKRCESKKNGIECRDKLIFSDVIFGNKK